MNTKLQANKCAAEADSDKVELIGGILIAIEIVYYSFELWKECHAQTSGPDEPPKAYLDEESGGTGNFPPRLLRRAGRGIERSARRLNKTLSTEEHAYWTNHALSHVYNTSAETVNACYAEVAFLDSEDLNTGVAE